jgi:hypothetical protein
VKYCHFLSLSDYIIIQLLNCLIVGCLQPTTPTASVHYIPGYNIFCSPYFNSQIVQNTQEISSVEILSFEVTKDILMLDVSVTISSTSSEGSGHSAPSATEVLRSLSLEASSGEGEGEEGKEEEKATGGDSTVVNPWTVESDGAIDYLR